MPVTQITNDAQDGPVFKSIRRYGINDQRSVKCDQQPQGLVCCRQVQPGQPAQCLQDKRDSYALPGLHIGYHIGFACQPVGTDIHPVVYPITERRTT